MTVPSIPGRMAKSRDEIASESVRSGKRGRKGTRTVAWASALVVTHKMGCLRCISAVATREILDFRLAKRKRPYPPVVVNKCCGCKFKDEFGNSHPRIQEDLQDLIAGHGG